MGLDVYAAHAPGLGLTEEDGHAFEQAGIELCAGIDSGFAGSFRGKVYDTLILDLTGVSLYQVWIPPEKVKQMAEVLRRIDPEEFERDLAGNYSWEEYSAETIVNLRKFFDLCAERELGLSGNW
jgi:hypothetical protein